MDRCVIHKKTPLRFAAYSPRDFGLYTKRTWQQLVDLSSETIHNEYSDSAIEPSMKCQQQCNVLNPIVCSLYVT